MLSHRALGADRTAAPALDQLRFPGHQENGEESTAARGGRCVCCFGECSGALLFSGSTEVVLHRFIPAELAAIFRCIHTGRGGSWRWGSMCRRSQGDAPCLCVPAPACEGRCPAPFWAALLILNGVFLWWHMPSRRLSGSLGGGGGGGGGGSAGTALSAGCGGHPTTAPWEAPLAPGSWWVGEREGLPGPCFILRTRPV